MMAGPAISGIAAPGVAAGVALRGPAAQWALPTRRVLAAAMVFMAMGLMAAGQVGYIPRLALGPVSANQLVAVLLAITLLWTVSQTGSARTLGRALAPLLLILPAAITLGWSQDLPYGIYKLGNLFALVMLLVGALCTAERLDAGFTRVCVIGFSLLMMAAAFPYKVAYGFVNPLVPYFMVGPIGFSWLMGIGCALVLAGPGRFGLRLALVAVFATGVAWSFQKGAILALFGLLLWWFVVQVRRQHGLSGSRGRDLALLGVGLLCLSGIPLLLFNQEAGVHLYGRFFSAWLDLSGMPSDSMSGTSRLQAWRAAAELIPQHPLAGIGLGSFGPVTGIESWGISMRYPHNLLLEAWSETGLLIGTAVIVPFFLYLLRPADSAWWFVALFLSPCLMVSGDLLDAGRYLLVFSLMAWQARFSRS